MREIVYNIISTIGFVFVLEREEIQMTKRRAKNGPGGLLQNPLVALLIVALIAVFFITKLSGGNSVASSYFCQGVYINGVDMSAYTRDKGEAMLTSWTDSLLNRSYSFTYNGEVWTFSPTDIGAKYNTGEVISRAWNMGHTGSKSDRANVQQSLRYSPQQFNTELSYSESKLDSWIEQIAEHVYVAPVDADIVLTATKPVVVSESSDGRELDKAALKDKLIDLVRNGSDTTVYELPVEVKKPAVSSDEAEDGLQLLVSYSTDLSFSSTSRCGNVKLALSNFNGFAVAPGEVVSFNEVVGERTAIRGYVEGTVYYGNNVTTGIGGGVCQASSTLYGAVVRAGMSIVERHNHTMVVAYCEASQDAAVSEDASQDFVFENDTDRTIYIYTNVINKEKATVLIYGSRPEYRIDVLSTITQNNIKNPNVTIIKDYDAKYAVYETQRVLVKEGKMGRKSKLERIYYDWETGAEVKRELISDDYYAGERDTYYQGVRKIDE